MGRKRLREVTPHGAGIQIDLQLADGRRIRPTLTLPATPANLKHAAKLSQELRFKIRAGTFNLAAEFPDFKGAEPSGALTFQQAGDRYLKLYGPDLARSSRLQYESDLKHHWYPHIGGKVLSRISDEDILSLRENHDFNPKTWNNILTPVRRIFAYAFEKVWIQSNPLAFIKNRKMQKPTPDPMDVGEAATVLAALGKMYGVPSECYFEFAFTTGLRSSEMIALRWEHVGLAKGEIVVRQARVRKENKETKTYRERTVKLVPRAVAVLERMRAVSGLANAHVFVDDNGRAWDTYHRLSQRWLITLRHAKIRHRKAYVTRSTSVTWQIMLGENLVKVASQHGHSVQTMLSSYAKWLERESDAAEIQNIKEFLGLSEETNHLKEKKL